MADAFTFVGDVLGGYISGRYTPVHNKVDPETRAKLLERYTRTLKELSVAEAQIRQEQIQTYGDVTSSFLAADAQALAAFAEAAKASATGAEAYAEYAKVFLADDAKFKAIRANQVPNEEALKVASTARVAAYNAGVSSIPATAIDKLRQAAERGDMSDPAAADAADAAFTEGLFRLVTDDAGIGTYLANTNAELNRIDPKDPSRIYTARAMEGEARQAVTGILAEKERELRAMNPDVYPEGVLTSRVDAYMDSVIKPAFTGQLGPEAAAAADAATLEAERIQNRREAFGESLASKYGIPAADLKRWRDIQDETHDLIKDPIAFSQKMSQMESPVDFTAERQRIRDEMDRLIDGDPDPLEEAVKNMAKTVPNFASWAGAMRFPNLERAAIYGSRHPNELRTFMRWQDRDPSIVNDPVRLRGEIAAYGAAQQREGGEAGYYTKRIERFFGARVGGAGPRAGTDEAAPADGVPDAEGSAFDSLPEASDEEAATRDAPDDPGTGVELPVYDRYGRSLRRVSSEFLDKSGEPSRVIDMGDGNVYQELDGGDLVILDGEGNGKRVKPGDPEWMALHEGIVEFHGPFLPGTSDLVSDPRPLLLGDAPAQEPPPAPAPAQAVAPAGRRAPAALPPGGFAEALGATGATGAIADAIKAAAAAPKPDAIPRREGTPEPRPPLELPAAPGPGALITDEAPTQAQLDELATKARKAKESSFNDPPPNFGPQDRYDTSKDEAWRSTNPDAVAHLQDKIAAEQAEEAAYQGWLKTREANGAKANEKAADEAPQTAPAQVSRAPKPAPPPSEEMRDAHGRDWVKVDGQWVDKKINAKMTESEEEEDEEDEEGEEGDGPVGAITPTDPRGTLAQRARAPSPDDTPTGRRKTG